MKRIQAAIIGFGLVICACLTIAAVTPSPDTHNYTVEYSKPTGDVPATLTVYVYTELSKEKARLFLRSQVDATVAAFEPQADVLATIWDGRGDVEKRLLTGDESLIYVAGEKRVMTMKDYVTKK